MQAINKDAPHPAAARLWQEFLYSDEGQNLWLKGGARPVRVEAMVKAGHARQGGAAALPRRRARPSCRPRPRPTRRQELPQGQLGQGHWLT